MVEGWLRLSSRTNAISLSDVYVPRDRNEYSEQAATVDNYHSSTKFMQSAIVWEFRQIKGWEEIFKKLKRREKRKNLCERKESVV